MNFINMLFYATPILYTAELFPETIRWVLYINPFTHVIDAYRNCFMYHTVSPAGAIIYMIVIALIYENDNVEPAMLRLQSLVKTVAFYREGIYCYYRTILR